MNDNLSRAGKTILIMIIVVGSITYVHGLHGPPTGQTSAAQAELPQSPADDFEDLLNSIEYVESRGNINAIGDNGQAIGCMQIHPIMIRDVNRILGWDSYVLNDRYDRNKSRQICKIYMNHYCKNMSLEDMAACWVAGPDGYLQKDKPAVRKYLEKIKNYLDNLQ